MEKIDDGFPPREASRLRKFVNLHPMNFSSVREEQEIIMCGSDEEVHYKIFLFDVDPHLPLSSAMLTPVEADGIPFDISGVGDRHHHILLGDKVFDADFWDSLHNFRLPPVSKGVADGDELLVDQIENQSLTGEEGFQAINQFDGLRILFDDFALFEVGEPLEPHLQDRLGLLIRKGKFFHQAVLRLFGHLGGLNRSDDGINMVNRLFQTLQDMRSGLCLVSSKRDLRSTTSWRC